MLGNIGFILCGLVSNPKHNENCSYYHYKKRVDLRRAFSHRGGGSNRPQRAPAENFTAGDFTEETQHGAEEFTQ